MQAEAIDERNTIKKGTAVKHLPLLLTDLLEEHIPAPKCKWDEYPAQRFQKVIMETLYSEPKGTWHHIPIIGKKYDLH